MLRFGETKETKENNISIVLTYPLNLDIIETNGLITLSKYPSNT